MKPVIIIIIIISWLGCGFLGAGLTTALYHRDLAPYWDSQRLHSIAEDIRISAKGYSFGILVLGPIGLFSILVMGGFGHYGFMWPFIDED